jgi:hypothetical protein
MKTSSPRAAFWVTNASPMNVTLSDLAINIKAFTTVNLLDTKHYNYTLDQLIKSKTSGSLFKKRDKIAIRDVAPPTIVKYKLPFLEESAIPSRERSVFSIKETEYDELKVSDDKDTQNKLDEEYAKEIIELTDPDTQDTATSKKV